MNMNMNKRAIELGLEKYNRADFLDKNFDLKNRVTDQVISDIRARRLDIWQIILIIWNIAKVVKHIFWKDNGKPRWNPIAWLFKKKYPELFDLLGELVESTNKVKL